jgi:hypothetical protein
VPGSTNGIEEAESRRVVGLQDERMREDDAESCDWVVTVKVVDVGDPEGGHGAGVAGGE